MLSRIHDLNDKVKSYLAAVRLRVLVHFQQLCCGRLISEANYHPRIQAGAIKRLSKPFHPRMSIEIVYHLYGVVSRGSPEKLWGRGDTTIPAPCSEESPV